MNRAKKLLVLHGCVLLAAAAYLLLVSSFGCPIRAVTGIPCPACGMTRAFVSLAHLDFAGSFAAHPLPLPTLIVVFMGVHRDTGMMRFVHRKTMDVILIGGAVVFFAVYLLRLYFSAIP